MICLLITGKAYSAHYQVLLIDCMKKELMLIEHLSAKPVDSKQIAEMWAVLESLGWSSKPVIKNISPCVTRTRNKVGSDTWALYHIQLGDKKVAKGKETPLCGPVACNVHCKLLCTQEENADNFCDLTWYDDLLP